MTFRLSHFGPFLNDVALRTPHSGLERFEGEPAAVLEVPAAASVFLKALRPLAASPSPFSPVARKINGLLHPLVNRGIPFETLPSALIAAVYLYAQGGDIYWSEAEALIRILGMLQCQTEKWSQEAGKILVPWSLLSGRLLGKNATSPVAAGSPEQVWIELLDGTIFGKWGKAQLLAPSEQVHEVWNSGPYRMINSLRASWKRNQRLHGELEMARQSHVLDVLQRGFLLEFKEWEMEIDSDNQDGFEKFLRVFALQIVLYESANPYVLSDDFLRSVGQWLAGDVMDIRRFGGKRTVSRRSLTDLVRESPASLILESRKTATATASEASAADENAIEPSSAALLRRRLGVTVRQIAHVMNVLEHSTYVWFSWNKHSMPDGLRMALEKCRTKGDFLFALRQLYEHTDVGCIAGPLYWDIMHRLVSGEPIVSGRPLKIPPLAYSLARLRITRAELAQALEVDEKSTIFRWLKKRTPDLLSLIFAKAASSEDAFGLVRKLIHISSKGDLRRSSEDYWPTLCDLLAKPFPKKRAFDPNWESVRQPIPSIYRDEPENIVLREAPERFQVTENELAALLGISLKGYRRLSSGRYPVSRRLAPLVEEVKRATEWEGLREKVAVVGPLAPRAKTPDRPLTLQEKASADRIVRKYRNSLKGVAVCHLRIYGGFSDSDIDEIIERVVFQIPSAILRGLSDEQDLLPWFHHIARTETIDFIRTRLGLTKRQSARFRDLRILEKRLDRPATPDDLVALGLPPSSAEKTLQEYRSLSSHGRFEPYLDEVRKEEL